MKGLLRASDEPCGRYRAALRGLEPSCFICRHFAGCVAVLNAMGLKVEISAKNRENAHFAGKRAEKGDFWPWGTFAGDSQECEKGPKVPEKAEKGENGDFGPGMGYEHNGDFGHFAQNGDFGQKAVFSSSGIRLQSARELPEGILTSSGMRFSTENAAFAGKSQGMSLR